MTNKVSDVPTPETVERQLCPTCHQDVHYNRVSKKWICDNCQISLDRPPPPPEKKKERGPTRFSTIAIALALVGFAIIGGYILETAALIIAVYAIRKGEGKAAWMALIFSLGAIFYTTMYTTRVAQLP